MLGEGGASQNGEGVLLGVRLCLPLPSHGAKISTCCRPGNRARRHKASTTHAAESRYRLFVHPSDLQQEHCSLKMGLFRPVICCWPGFQLHLSTPQRFELSLSPFFPSLHLSHPFPAHAILLSQRHQF